MREETLSNALAVEICKPSLDLLPDYSELALNAFINIEIFKEVPVVKTAMAIFKTGSAIRDRHFLSKVLVFIHEVHTGGTNGKIHDEFRLKIESDPDFRQRIMDHLLVVLDRYLLKEKAQILANLFKAYSNNQLDWTEFVEASVILDSLHLSGYKFLAELSRGEPWFGYHGNARPEEALLFAAGLGVRHGSKFSVTPLGVKLFHLGIDPFLKRA